MAKTMKTALRAESRRRVSRSQLLGHGAVLTLVLVVGCAGGSVPARIESIRSNRFDSVSPMSRPRQPRPTLRAVAAGAGVSTSTASLAFSGKGPVAPETVGAGARRRRPSSGMPGPTPWRRPCGTAARAWSGSIVEGRLLHAFRDPFAVSVLDGLSQVLDEIPAGMLLIAQPAGRPGRPSPSCRRRPRRRGLLAVRPATQPGGRPPGGARHTDARRRRRPRTPGSPSSRLDNRGASASARPAPAGTWATAGSAHLMMPLRPDSADRARRRRATSAARRSPTRRDRALGFLDVFGPDSPAGGPTARGDPRRGAGRHRRRGCCSTGRRPSGRQPSSPSPTCWRWGSSAPPRSWACGCPRTSASPGSTGSSCRGSPGTLTTIDQHGEEKGRRLGAMVRALLDGDQAPNVVLPTELRVGTTTAPPAP